MPEPLGPPGDKEGSLHAVENDLAIRRCLGARHRLGYGGPWTKRSVSAISEQTREAVALKKQGLPVATAVARLSSQPLPDSVPSAQHDFYKAKLPGATRFAYMAGMSGDGAAAFYLKQCLQGS